MHTPCNNFMRRNGNELSCGFDSRLNWKRFVGLDFGFNLSDTEKSALGKFSMHSSEPDT